MIFVNTFETLTLLTFKYIFAPLTEHFQDEKITDVRFSTKSKV